MLYQDVKGGVVLYIVVVGAGQVGYYLTKTLLTEGHEVTLVDWNFEKVKRLEMELGGAVIYASGSSIDGLEKAGCRRADVIVAVTGDDEDNLVVCQIGKRYFKVPKAIARINNPKNEKVFKKLGVGTIVSGTISIAEEIENYVERNRIKTLLSFSRDEMVLLETEIDEDSPVVNKKIKEISLPDECIVALIIRGKQAIFGRGDTKLQVKDLIIALATRKEQENVKRILLGSLEA
jgi:trk system potassium uptake protein